MSLPQAVILAGGKGTRLRPLTESIPKVMVDINGKPFLSYLLQLLRRRGFTDVLLLVSYLGEQVEGYFGSGKKYAMRIQYSYERPAAGTAGALKQAGRLLSPEFFLLNGDTYLDMDYRRLFSFFRERSCTGALCAYVNPGRKLQPNLALSGDRMVMRYCKDAPQGLQQVDAGVAVYSKTVLDFIPGGSVVSMEHDIYPKLISARQLCAMPQRRKFLDMGTFQRLALARTVIR